MNVAMGAALMWVGGALLWVATHDTGASTPWQAYQAILGAVRGTTDPAASADGSSDTGTVTV